MTSFYLLVILPALLSGGEQAVRPPEIVYEKFGEITVDGKVYEKDIVIEKGKVRKRDKDPSKGEKAKYGHTPLTEKEPTPWDCKTLVIGTGMHGRLPIVPAFKEEAKKRGVKLVILKMKEAVKYFTENYGPDVNAVFHITC